MSQETGPLPLVGIGAPSLMAAPPATNGWERSFFSPVDTRPAQAHNRGGGGRHQPFSIHVTSNSLTDRWASFWRAEIISDSSGEREWLEYEWPLYEDERRELCLYVNWVLERLERSNSC